MPDWDEKYRRAAPFGDAPNEYVRQILARSDFAARTALCLADGDGRNSVWLAAKGLKVTAVDYSAVATEKAYARDEAAGVAVERITADLASWSPPPERKWDAVFLIYLQSDAQTRARAIKIAANALAPDGWFILEGFAKTPEPKAGLGPEDASVLYDMGEVEKAAAGLKVIEAFEGRTFLDEGEKHRGEGIIIRFAARKV